MFVTSKLLKHFLFGNRYGTTPVQPHLALNKEAESQTKNEISFAAAIVLLVHYPDEITNSSAVRNVVSLSMMDNKEQIYRDFRQDKQVFSRVIGHRIECDILVYHFVPGRFMSFMIRHVPVLQRGGLNDCDIWIPKGTTNWDGSKTDQLNIFNLDGDHVLVGFIGNIFPQGAVILGGLPHPLNKEDVPRDLYGSFGAPKTYGDRVRKDGKIHFSCQNGTITKTDLYGNMILDTTQANRLVKTDIDTGEVTVSQDNTPWTSAGNTAPMGDEDPNGDPLPFDQTLRRSKEIESPGGGDLDLRVKNSRKVKLSFYDNTVEPVKEENPPLFKETGFIQITNDGSTRKIEICLSDSVTIRVRKFGNNDADVNLNVDDNCNVNTGKDCNVTVGENCDVEVGQTCTIYAKNSFNVNTDTGVAAIILGGDVEQLATKKFVEDVFCLHTHSVLAEPAETPINTSTPQLVPGEILGGAQVNPTTGTLDLLLIPVTGKIATTKTKAE